MPNYNLNRRIIKNANLAYDPDAQAFFDEIGDIPFYAKNAINQKILDFKTNLGGLDVSMCYFFPPTRKKFDGFREFVSKLINGNQVYNTSNAENPAPLYNYPRAYVGVNGATFWGGGAYRTSFIPSANLLLNDTCWLAGYPDDDIASAGFNFGAFNSSIQSMIFQKRSATNSTYADMYGSNTASGRAQYTGTGTGAIYGANRPSGVDFGIFEDGIEKEANILSQGTLPSVEILINGYKTTTTNGVGSNDNCSFICIYSRGLNPVEFALETISWQNFQTAMNRTGSYLASVIADGDSHFAYWNSAMMSEFNAQFWGYPMNIQNIAISGQTLTQMISGASVNLYPKIQPGRGVYYLLCGGGTNDISEGASAATTWSRMQTTVANAKADAASKGILLHAIHIPLLNRGYVDTAKILEQDVYNELVRNNYAAGDHYVDFPEQYSAKSSDYSTPAEFISAVLSFCADPNYFHEPTHLVDGPLGYPTISTLLANKVKTILGI